MYSNWTPTKEKEIMNKSKLYDWIAGILSAAVISLFGFALNANTYIHKIDTNSKDIENNTKDIRKIEVDFNQEIKLLRKERAAGNLEVIKAVNQLKIELQNKKNRDN